MQNRQDLLVALKRIAVPQPYAIAIADIKNLQNLPRWADIFGGSYDEAMDNLLNGVANIARKIGKRYKVHLVALCADSVVLGGGNVERVFLGVVDLIRETTCHLNKIDYDKFGSFGLLRVGITWRDDGSDAKFQGMRPGILAHYLANQHGQALGAVNVTEAVLDHLPPEHRGRFVAKGKDCDQGKIFVRHWSPKKDLA